MPSFPHDYHQIMSLDKIHLKTVEQLSEDFWGFN